MPPTTELRTTLGQNSYVSLGLVLALLAGATVFGRQMQRLDGIEAQLRDVSAEVREIRSFVVRPTSTGR